MAVRVQEITARSRLRRERPARDHWSEKRLMAKIGEEPGAKRSAPSLQAEDLLGLGAEVAIAIATALNAGRSDEAAELAKSLHFAEIADLLEQLKSEQRHQLVERMRVGFDPAILAELDEVIREEVAEQLGTESLAGAIAKIETDDALTLLGSLDSLRQRQIMQALPTALRTTLEQGLAYPEDSAGRLMQSDFVAVPTFWTVGETIDFLREADHLPNDFYDIFVIGRVFFDIRVSKSCVFFF